MHSERGPCDRDGPAEESGFTLIELLVVVIIIGILAAIAIPVYMRQRNQAFDAAAKSDLRNVAQFEEGYLVDHQAYATIADLTAAGELPKVSRGDTVTILFASDQGYCLTSQHASSGNRWYYDNQAGGIQAKGSTGCPVTTSGTAGGQLVGG